MADPGAAARAFRIVWIAVVEADNFGVPALHQLAELHLDHLAVADRDRIADLRHLIIGAPPIVLPANMPQVFAAAQLDHGEVPDPARLVWRDPALEGGHAFGGEVAALTHVVLMTIEELRVPAPGVVVLNAMRCGRQNARRDELRRADHRPSLSVEVELASPVERS